MSLLAGVAILGILTGCESSRGLYFWGNYPAMTHAYLRQDKQPRDVQLQKLLETLREAESSKLAVPPGLHAQIALLLAQSGDRDQALFHFEEEKRLFPESTTYIDFLISNSGSAG